eukprot:SAG31_NODE_2236_length_6119_cov_15.764784_6_plen_48_part_00
MNPGVFYEDTKIEFGNGVKKTFKKVKMGAADPVSTCRYECASKVSLY